MLTQLFQKLYFDALDEGLDLFVECMGFETLHQSEGLAVVGRDGVKIHLCEDSEQAAVMRPEVFIETDGIDDFYAEVSGRRPELLHPNVDVVTQRPWGVREFALLDKTKVCEDLAVVS